MKKNVEIPSDSRIEGFILIGGASSRMGTDKAQLELNGQSFLEVIASELCSIAQPVRSVSSNALPGGSFPHIPNIPDVHPRWGALGGLHTALAAAKSSWVAVVACDLPFVTADLFRRLAMLREGFDAVVPVQADGRPQPLCALYHTESCLPEATKLIATGERRPRALLAAVNTRWVSPAELDDLSGAANFFANINTPADYDYALSLSRSTP